MPRSWLLLFSFIFAFGCSLPKYVGYTSTHQDFSCEIPWGWSIVQDASGSDYTNVTFIGPMNPEFYRGVPSIGIRWYAVNAPHRLPDGSYEIYSSYQDFMRQMVKQVYSPGGVMKAGSDRELEEARSQGKDLKDFKTVQVSGWEGFYTVVYHNQPVASGPKMGVLSNDQGKRIVLERHAYVLLPMNGGFYVFVYPATKDGFEKYQTAFFHLVNTFKAHKDGPAGGPIKS